MDSELEASDPRSYEAAVERQRTRGPAPVRVRLGWSPSRLIRELARTDERIIDGEIVRHEITDQP